MKVTALAFDTAKEGEQFVPWEAVLLLDALLEGGKRVGGGGQGCPIHAEGVELHPALTGVQS